MYNWRGKNGPLRWEINGTIYLSVVFSWDLPIAERIKVSSKKKVIIGGPAAKLAGYDIPELSYPALSIHNPFATKTSTGCINACPFCAVPDLEGDLVELRDWEPRPIVCDNNLLACSRKHFDTVIDRLKLMPFVDFNQGLEARLFTTYHAERIAELKAVKVRFSYDCEDDQGAVYDAVLRCRAQGMKDIGVYVLIGYEDTPEEAKTRLEWVRSLGIWPNPMRYQPLRATVKDEYVEKGWTKGQLEDMVRYYSRLFFLEHIPFEEYKYKQHEQEGRLL